MPKPHRNRKLAFLPRVNKAEATSIKKTHIKILSSKRSQLKTNCKFSSAGAPI